MEYVRNYDVKKLLLDARQTDIVVDKDSYVSVITGFFCGLAATRLRKVASHVAPGSQRGWIIRGIFEDIHFPMEVRAFAEVASAVEWLKAKS